MDVAAVAFAFFSAVLMGTIGVFSKITGLPAEIITFFRLFLGAGFMLLYLVAIRKADLLRRWPSWPVLINGCFLAGFIIFYVQAMNYTSMANAIMLVYLAPLAASVIAHFFLNERLNRLGVALIVLAIFGFAMMMEFKVVSARQSAAFIGICFGLLALACYAGFILLNRVVPKQVHVYARAFYQLLVGALVMLPLVFRAIGSVSMQHVPWLIGTGFFPGFLAITFAVIALSRLPASTFGTIAYIEPVAVVVFGWAIFGERLNPLQIGGCLLIMTSGLIKTLTMKGARRGLRGRRSARDANG